MRKLIYLSVAVFATTFFISCTNDSLEISNEKFPSSQVNRVGTDALGTGAQVVDLYVVAGQSNALGWLSRGYSFPAYNNYRVRLAPSFVTGMQFRGWKSLSRDSQNGYFGPEMDLGIIKSGQGRNVAILKHGIGSSGMNYWTGGVNGLTNAMKAAANDLRAQGHTVRVSGVAWIQGEEDSKYQNTANAYAGKLSIVLGKIKSTANSINQTNGFGNITRYVIGFNENCPAPYSQTVSTAQKNYAAANSNSWLSFGNLPVSNDMLHFTAFGIRKQGQMIASRL